jgi:hypothetical protein
MHFLALALALQVAGATELKATSSHLQSVGLVPADTTAVPPTATARRLTGSIRVDGTLDEPVWQLAPVATDFTQWEPDEGEPATQRTEVRFLFDSEALYVGARMYDAAGASGVTSRLFRRDGDFESDRFQLLFDTFHDHLGRSSFTVNPAGVKGDWLSAGGANPDQSWDPVWDVATTIDSLGWTAEFRIPFSQLRFSRDAEQTWGLQIWRTVHRLNELSMWSFFRATESGGPAFFGHLEGLTIQESPAKGEILPYVVARNARLGTADVASPFYRANDVGAWIGIDFKYLLTSNLTLTGTINPDFGQVEVDPAVVNLTAFETYFAEKRPFFVEGRGYFLFGGLSCFFCDGASGLQLLYSRRIGRAPQGAGFAQAAGDYADIPNNATILGAAKVTGRTASGWSVGVLNAVTAREYARVAAPDASQFDTEVEPLSNYFAGRVAKDFLEGNLQVRAMVTSVVRDLRDPALAGRLTRHAEAGGLDAQWWLGRAYRWTLSAAVTQVAGDSTAMLGVQRSSARYFQRPDREHGANGLFTDAYDPGLRAMRGWGVESRLSREAGNWLWEVNAGARSPGFETNDLAFLQRTDYVWMNANLVRRRTTPQWLFRNYWLLLGGQQQYNFDGDLVSRQARASANVTFRNYWTLSTFAIHRLSTLCDQITRGGPVVRVPAHTSWYAGVWTDRRKPLSAGLELQLGASGEGARDHSIRTGITIRPTTNLSVQVGPSFDHSESTAQYVTAASDSMATTFYGTRYVFSDLTQRSLSMNVRLNVAFTPTLTLDLYLQPLIASGRYSNFKEFDRPRELAKSVFGSDVGTITSAGGAYTVDPDGAGPAAQFAFEDPDFNFRSLRGNAVLRWEFRPGSTLYFAWTQTRSDVEQIGTMNLRHDLDALIDAKADNVFLVKLSYWIGL